MKKPLSRTSLKKVLFAIMAITFLSSGASILNTNAWAMTEKETEIIKDISCIYKESKCELTYTDYSYKDTPKNIRKCLKKLSETPSGVQLIVEYRSNLNMPIVFKGEKISTISNNHKMASSCKETLENKVDKYLDILIECEENLLTYIEIFDYCKNN